MRIKELTFDSLDYYPGEISIAKVEGTNMKVFILKPKLDKQHYYATIQLKIYNFVVEETTIKYINPKQTKIEANKLLRNFIKSYFHQE